ncbi:MAG: thiol peroxidase [Planctomycetota bacterium]|jgi:thiol peroxidase
MERENVITFQGNPLTLVGDAVSVGQSAPDFTVAANDLSPYVDTPVCDTQTRKFNEAAADLGDDVVVLTVSMDLPFAQSRWCGAAGVDQVKTVSDYKEADFGRKYGLLIKELHLLARAVLVIDSAGIIRYSQLVSEVTEEPDYSAVIEAVKGLL